MGEVWLASALGRGGFEKRLVLKTIRPERAASPVFVKMFAEEARLTARLNHPNLIDVFDFAEDRGIYFLAMEYLPGRSLSQIVRASRKRQRAIPDWFSLRVLADCCRGLHYAHEQSGIIHCDLSPGNVMVAFTGLTKVVDFGVAQTRQAVRKSGHLNGKFPYMAPERIQNHPADCRSDVYSLGVIMYLLFTGRLPFSGATDEELLAAITAGAPPSPGQLGDVADDIEAVILRAIDLDPASRFQSAGDFGRCIESLLARRRGPGLEQEIALYLSSLFPDAPEIPANIRSQIGMGTPTSFRRAETAATRPMSSAIDEAPLTDADPILADLERDLSWEIDIRLEDSELCLPEASAAGPAVQGSEEEPASGPPEPDSGVTRIQQLFATTARPAPAPAAALPAPERRSLFEALEGGTRTAFDAAARSARPAGPAGRARLFDGYLKRKDPASESWPWSTNFKKRQGD
jgi:serine/threonine protein kinase